MPNERLINVTIFLQRNCKKNKYWKISANKFFVNYSHLTPRRDLCSSRPAIATGSFARWLSFHPHSLTLKCLSMSADLYSLNSAVAGFVWHN